MSQKPYNILIVEDNAVIRETLNAALEMEGYMVREANDGLEALTLLRQAPLPDLILLDLMMPRMNGWEFIAAIKKDVNAPAAKVPIIVVSAVTDKTQGISNLVQGIIKKPILLDKLFSEIERICPSIT